MLECALHSYWNVQYNSSTQDRTRGSQPASRHRFQFNQFAAISASLLIAIHSLSSSKGMRARADRAVATATGGSTPPPPPPDSAFHSNTRITSHRITFLLRLHAHVLYCSCALPERVQRVRGGSVSCTPASFRSICMIVQCAVQCTVQCCSSVV